MFAFEPCVTWYLWFNHRGRESTSYSYLKSSTSPINISTINWIRIADVSAAISLLSRPLIQNDMPTPQANCTSNHQPIMTIDSCSHQQDRQLDFHWLLFTPTRSATWFLLAQQESDACWDSPPHISSSIRQHKFHPRTLSTHCFREWCSSIARRRYSTDWASSGIGASIAEHLLKEGAKVTLDRFYHSFVQ